jgi:hypothetical protein
LFKPAARVAAFVPPCAIFKIPLEIALALTVKPVELATRPERGLILICEPLAVTTEFAKLILFAKTSNVRVVLPINFPCAVAIMSPLTVTLLVERDPSV